MTLLLLAGTSEARQIAGQLAGRGGVMASLSGAVQDVPAYPVPMRTGGFGGEAGFHTFLDNHEITAVLDATHPFAARMTERTSRICRDRGLPYLRLTRPAWAPEPDDHWQIVATPEEAVQKVPNGGRVFLATGAQEIGRYAPLDGRAEVFCRRAEDRDTPFPFARGRWIIGRGPFDIAAETTLLQQLGIEVVVTKNAGGTASRAKLDAARALGLPVIMIARPPDPKGVPVVDSVEAALKWVGGL
jgi:precorrin-6A/cobalt-precorrin-6A reductase